jgi:hypothetical protein
MTHLLLILALVAQYGEPYPYYPYDGGIVAIPKYEIIDTLAVCNDSALVVKKIFSYGLFYPEGLTPFYTDTLIVKRCKPVSPLPTSEKIIEDWLKRQGRDPEMWKIRSRLTRFLFDI